MIAVFFFDPDTGYTQLLFNDNPLLKAPTDRLPYRAVGLISTERDQPKIFCTGFPVVSTVILTAAHCLYNQDDNIWRQQLFYFPSALTQKAPPIEAKNYIVPQEFIDSYLPRSLDKTRQDVFDFGVIILNRRLDKNIFSAFSLTVEYVPPSSTDLPYATHYPIPSPSAGASGELPDAPKKTDDYRMIVGYSLGGTPYNDEDLSDMIHTTFCRPSSYWQKDNNDKTHYLYAYKCSATGGMSGSPILFKESDRHYKVLGIHIVSNRYHNINSGIHINDETLTRIRYWISHQSANADKDATTTFYDDPDRPCCATL